MSTATAAAESQAMPVFTFNPATASYLAGFKRRHRVAAAAAAADSSSSPPPFSASFVVSAVNCAYCTLQLPLKHMLHDPFVCGVIPRVLEYMNKHDIPASSSYALLDVVLEDCARYEHDAVLYADYCYAWTTDLDANMDAIRKDQPSCSSKWFSIYARVITPTKSTK